MQFVDWQNISFKLAEKRFIKNHFIRKKVKKTFVRFMKNAYFCTIRE